MKHIFTACALAAAALLAAPAFAQGYIGGGFGSSKLTGVDGDGYTGGNTSKGLVKIYGGYQITPSWGVEAQYADLGRRTLALAGVNVGSFGISQMSIAGTGTLPLGSGFSLLGKLGVSSSRPTGSGVSGNSKTSALIGFGAAYSITPALSARVEYEDFGKLGDQSNNGVNNSVRANGYSISLKYAF